jgi:hypothetical protein
MRVLLPTLGFPMIFTNPALCAMIYFFTKVQYAGHQKPKVF